MATSANFGNMFSMVGASLFLPFLPLLPKQVLLMNLMTDFPEMSIATDRVDHEWIDRPNRWDIGFIHKSMITFGILSSVFDYLIEDRTVPRGPKRRFRGTVSCCRIAAARYRI
jgi:Mg2+-importing ATPase